MKHQKIHQPRIVLIAGIILTIVTLLAGVTVFIVMQRHAEELLDKSLQLSLQSRVQLTETEIGAGFDKTVIAATRPFVLEQLPLLNARADDSTARNKLNGIALSFLQQSVRGIAFYGEDGQELTRVGVFAQQPELAVPLNLPGDVQLMWDGQLLLRAVVDIKKEGRVVGKVMTESSLLGTMGAIRDANRLGETGELALCAPFGLKKIQCFPTNLLPNVLTRSQSTSKGDPLPMAHALAGETGFVIARDYRNQKVAAAYAPVGDLGLGMVLKMDSAELYAPVWNQLRYLIPLLLGMLIIALLLLRWRLTQLLTRLQESEQRFRSIFEYSKVGMSLQDADGRYSDVNPAYVKMMGYSVEELRRFSFSEVTHPDDIELSTTLGNTLLTGASDHFELEKKYICKDGSTVWADVTVSAGRDDAGKLVSFIGVHQDISKRKLAEHSLRASEEKFRAYFDHSMVGMAVTSLEKGWVNVNDALCASLGYSREELMRLNWAELTYPEDLALDNEQFNRVLKGEIDNYALDKRFIHKDGYLVYTQLAVGCVRKKDGTVDYIVALVEDVTERKRVEAELVQFKSVLDNTLDMIFMFEPESLRFVYANQGAVLSMGYSREELLVMTPYQIKPLISEPEFRQLILPLLSGEQPSLRFDTVHRRKDGTDFSVAIFLQVVMQSDGSGLFVAIVRDITENKKSEELIWHQANFDTLTDLPNRRMFYDRLEQEIKKSHRSGLPMALMMLDLDNFKEVNDTLGHAQGDVLLIEAARRIAECVRESDTVARLGGDEFVVILSELEDVNSIERIAQKIVESLAVPFQLLQETAYVSASMGITLYPDDAQDVEALIMHADQAMYVAKNAGRNRYSYFTAALQEASQNRLHLISDLRDALAGQQFQVFYQPIVTLANGAIHKAEALLRWQHPTRGLISPAEFIPVAEETGMIIDIGDWVFREVAKQAAHWRASHYHKFQISVNVSPVQFRHKGTNFKAWLAYMQELGLPGQGIVMEITEGLLLEANTSVTDQLLAFRDAGIRVALDDFGTGYSSLSYLKKFDIDYLKIDQSFVRNLQDDPSDQALCEAIIVMAHKLGLKVIAEGVETEQQRDLLAAYGCDYAQGWLYSKAVPVGEFEALLKEQAK